MEHPVSNHPKKYVKILIVVTYRRWSLIRPNKNRATGVFEKVSSHIDTFEQNALYAISTFMLHVRIVPCCHCKFVVYSELRRMCSRQREHAMRQVVAY